RRRNPAYRLPTASFKDFPALKAGTRVAGISMAWPVAGFTPRRGARSRTSKVPKPTKVTFSPLARASEITEKTDSTASLAALRVSPVFSATWVMRSHLFTVSPPYALVLGLPFALVLGSYGKSCWKGQKTPFWRPSGGDFSGLRAQLPPEGTRA